MIRSSGKERCSSELLCPREDLNGVQMALRSEWAFQSLDADRKCHAQSCEAQCSRVCGKILGESVVTFGLED